MKSNILIFIINSIFLNSMQTPLTTTTAIYDDNNISFLQQALLTTRLNYNVTQRQLNIAEKSFVYDTGENKDTSHNFPQPNTLALFQSEHINSSNQHVKNITPVRDKVPFSNEETTPLYSFSKEERLCFTENRVYYNDSCQELLQTGTCNDGQWLVLDLKSALLSPPKIVPKCEKKFCKFNQFYWKQTRKCFNDSEYNNSLLCPSGNVVETDFFGYGTCECKTGNGLFQNGSCFELYTQGPCLKGYLFIENDINKTECVRNPCSDSTLVPWEAGDKKCYTLGKQGPCKNNFIFQVSQKTRKPDCADHVALLSVIGGPHLCPTDEKQGCLPEVKLKENNKDYFERIIAQSQKRRT
ncbi:uncharacterized protein LOC142321737 [Lycorma delicatula]|uniref:uncharacterized protein LOC142321737 n=1 Tax=Lycorma delicatula TaxID=130591 RepID=UPI003F514283